MRTVNLPMLAGLLVWALIQHRPVGAVGDDARHQFMEAMTLSGESDSCPLLYALVSECLRPDPEASL